MTLLVATFDAPEDITLPGFDGKIYRFPFSVLEEQHIGTPRQSSNIICGRITVKASRSVISIWGLSSPGIVKALFQLAKEQLASSLKNTSVIENNIEFTVDTSSHPGQCPFDIEMIEEPRGAIIQLEIHRPIDFV